MLQILKNIAQGHRANIWEYMDYNPICMMPMPCIHKTPNEVESVRLEAEGLDVILTPPTTY